jgi:ABC-type multidrug transport system ATPase subunit
MSEIIKATNLSKSYQQIKAVDDLTLAVNHGDFFGFLGPNGAGKTTTIRMLTGIIKPDRGEITIDGLASDEREKIARLIGVVPESRGLYEWMTALEYLQFFANIYGIKGRAQKEIVDSLLSQVDLAARKDSKIGTYSRGMRQRLGLARALINKPQILFLDEPTLGLDPQGQEDIQNLLLQLNQEGVTIFLSSHLLHEVSNLCSRIAIINKGKLIVEGSMDELRRKTSLQESYRLRIVGGLKALEASPFSQQITKQKHDLNATDFVFQGNTESANQLLDLLREQGIPILEFSSESDNLTDIFLSLTS